jgi:hypothetical protein
MKQHLPLILRKCTVAIVALACTQSATAQIGIFNKLEAGVTIGPSNFLGDLGGNRGKGTTFLKDNNFSQTRLFVGAHLTAYHSHLLGFRLAANYGTISGDDAAIKGMGGLEEARRFRNSNFKSRLAEAMLVAEVYPSVLFEMDPDDIFHKFRPYGVIGVGVFHFNPMGTDPLTGDYVYLKPLKTEGQGFEEYPDRKDYKLTQLNIPMGLGFKYFLSEKTSLSLEVLHRKTFTDYIDDVSTTYIDPDLFDKYFGVGSQKAQLARRMANKTDQSSSASAGYGPGHQRGTPTQNDAYYSFNLKLSFFLPRTSNSDRQMRCPTFRF